MNNTIVTILMLGDLYGKTGRDLFARHSATLKEKYSLDAIIVNGENSADGRGITPDIAQFFLKHGASVITTGNHIWAKKDIIPYLKEHDTVLRPANYPSECPGKGIAFFTCKGFVVAIINLMGRLAMPADLSCPFKKAEELVAYARTKTPIVLIDMHAETPYEKASLAYFLEGKASVVVGTHTHVQTADAHILPTGTAYMSDLGMSGSLHSMIGSKSHALIQKFITQMPTKTEVATDAPYVVSGAIVTIAADTGKAVSIEPLYLIDKQPL